MTKMSRYALITALATFLAYFVAPFAAINPPPVGNAPTTYWASLIQLDTPCRLSNNRNDLCIAHDNLLLVLANMAIVSFAAHQV